MGDPTVAMLCDFETDGRIIQLSWHFIAPHYPQPLALSSPRRKTSTGVAIRVGPSTAPLTRGCGFITQRCTHTCDGKRGKREGDSSKESGNVLTVGRQWNAHARGKVAICVSPYEGTLHAVACSAGLVKNLHKTREHIGLD